MSFRLSDEVAEMATTTVIHAAVAEKSGLMLSYAFVLLHDDYKTPKLPRAFVPHHDVY